MWFSSMVSELRRHPVVYGACCAMTALGCALALWHTGRSWARGGGLPGWWIWIALALIAVPQLWMARVLRRGPFSRDAREQARFWKTARQILMIGGLWILFSAALLTGVAGWFAWRHRLPLGLPEESMGQLALHVGTPVLLGAGAFLAGWKLGRRVRRLEGRCARCGYSLKDLPEPRCPECGTPFNPADYPDLSSSPPERRRA
jgi:hypothetical protein